MENGVNEIPIVEIDFGEAKKYADFLSIKQDLNFVLKACSCLKKMKKENSEDSLIMESLWATALIKYARCFTSGKRFGLNEMILNDLKRVDEEGDLREVHKFYMNLRNKHIAHSVNPFEQVKVGLALSPDNIDEKKVEGFGYLYMRHVYPSYDEFHQFGVLTFRIKNRVSDIIKQSEEIILKKGKRMSIDDLYNRPRLRTTIPSPKESKISRH